MASIIKVDQLSEKTQGSGITLSHSLKLKSSGDSITKSDGTTAVLSESGGVVTLNNGTIGSGVVFPAGHIINIWSAIRATQYDHTAGANWATVSDLSIPITIGFGNKVLIMASLHISASLFDGRRAMYRIVRNTPSDPTPIAVSTDKTNNGSGGTLSNSASNGGPFATVFLDTPSATSVTYSVQLANFDSVTTYLNRLSVNSGAFSSFTLLEIQQ